MYNRYSLPIEDDFAAVETFAGSPPPGHHPQPPHHPHQLPPPPPPHHPPPAHCPPPPLPPIHKPDDCIKDGGGLLGSLKGLLGNLHIPKLELDDLLLLAIAYLILRESGDDDLLLILGALFLFGLVD